MCISTATCPGVSSTPARTQTGQDYPLPLQQRTSTPIPIPISCPSTTYPTRLANTCGSFLDGLVLSLTPFHNSCNYRSAVVYGHAQLVSDRAEALYAMQKITDNLLPQRWDKSRVPPTEAELKSTSILRVRIASASAKIRVGGNLTLSILSTATSTCSPSFLTDRWIDVWR
jgi:hypothetical protein